ncbi:MAG: hypothetical protein Ct9H300mP20_15460 [Gammaproteobacteria bacterium]|nr:MAG: hypothetical protein Ct9H300mP20_15460 [Gammaproteobacteria bacterium]
MLFSQASTVCINKVFMVIGPTPPGTGVYAEHFPSTSSRAISPHFSGW